MNNTKVFLIRPRSFLERNNNHPRSCCIPWTLKYIQTVLKNRGLPVCFYDVRVRGHSNDEALKLIKDMDPHYIITQANSIEYEDCKKLLKQVRKQSRAKIILVGQYASHANSETKDIDFYFKGESEKVVSDFITGNNGSSLKQDDIHIVGDVDSLPFLHYEKRELSYYFYPYPIKMMGKIIWGSLLSSRGCPHDCVFCTQILRESYGKKFRPRNAANVVKEIKYLMRLGANVISFEDDSFTVSPGHVDAICDELIAKGVKVKWICQARVDEVDFPLLKKMKDAGCVLIRFGVESGSPRILEIIGKTKCGKKWIERTKEVFRLAKELGVPTDAMLIMGTPTETEEDIRQSISLAKEIDPDIIQVSFFTLYHGSLAYEKYKAEIEKSGRKNIYHYGAVRVNLSKVDSGKLLSLQKAFYRSVLFRPGFLLKHFANYLLFYVTNCKKAYRVLNPRNFF